MQDKYEVERSGYVNDSYGIDFSSPTFAFIAKNRRYIGERILDVGCSGGYHLFSTVELFGKYGVGIDINPKQIEYAERLRRPEDAGVEFRNVNVLEIRSFFDRGSFDTVMMFHTMEHFPEEDLEEIFEGLKWVLKPDGAFLILVPYEHAHDSVGHNTYWNEDSLRLFMEKIGTACVVCEKYVNEQLIGIFLNAT